MLGARKMQVNETGQQMGVDQLAARTVRDSGRVVGKLEVIHVEPISNDKSACVYRRFRIVQSGICGRMVDSTVNAT